MNDTHATITAFEYGPVDTVGYAFEDLASAEVLIIDTPLGSGGDIITHVRERSLLVRGIILTHGHFDHIGDAAFIAEELAVPVYLHSGDAEFLRDPMGRFPGLPYQVRGMHDFRTLDTDPAPEIGGRNPVVIHTPGHSPGGICLYFEEQGVLFSGDTLFAGSIGRSDLPGGEYDVLLQSITRSLLSLPDGTLVYPGHGPATTIAAERGSNPFIREYLEHF